MTWPVLSTEELRAQADRLPRVRLAHLPTPLEEAPRFAAQVGDVRVFLKRDDCTGLLLGGNKARHNEFLLADAVHSGCDMLVWGAGVQSNNCRQTAAGCARLGLECRLYLSRGHYATDVQGNLLLDHLVGAKVEIVDAPLGPALEELLAAQAEMFRSLGRNPYVWDRPRVLPLAAVSYALCLAEIVDQCREQGVQPSAVYVSSAGGTGAGLALGKLLLGLDEWRVRSVCPMRWPWDTRAALAATASRGAELLGQPHRFSPADIDVTEEYIGPCYGKASPAGREALHLLAAHEGILLDPVYSAKAMAGLIDDIRQRRIAPGDAVVFIHTGGTPAIFAQREEVFPPPA
jgi:1-aminocyclopropane-1-carboxylate deaminase/D-cysteine desulfhydrase-like pyridoxal-dependent ACC family enzyme